MCSHLGDTENEYMVNKELFLDLFTQGTAQFGDSMVLDQNLPLHPMMFLNCF